MRYAHDLFRTAALCAAVAVCSPVHADVTIVSQIETQGDPSNFQLRSRPMQDISQTSAPRQDPASKTEPPSIKTTTTTYYKGKMARVEAANGTVTIYDGVANKVYTLRPDRKTYKVLSIKQALSPNNAAMLGLPRGMGLTTKLDFSKINSTETLLGKEMQRYSVEATVQPSADDTSPRRQGRGQGGGFPGGGYRRHRFPLGGMTDEAPAPQTSDGAQFPGGGGYQRSQGARQLPSIRIEGDYWLTDGAFLPKENRYDCLPLLAQSLGPAEPVLKPLFDRMVKLKQVPLSARVLMALNRPGSSETASPVVVTLNVISITPGSVDEALFKVPADYTLAAPEKERDSGSSYRSGEQK